MPNTGIACEAGNATGFPSGILGTGRLTAPVWDPSPVQVRNAVFENSQLRKYSEAGLLSVVQRRHRQQYLSQMPGHNQAGLEPRS